jgi:hypothetical protein
VRLFVCWFVVGKTNKKKEHAPIDRNFTFAFFFSRFGKEKEKEKKRKEENNYFPHITNKQKISLPLCL